MKLEIRERDRRALLFLTAAALLYGVFSFGLLPGFDALQQSASGSAGKEDQLSKYRRALIRKVHYAQLLDQSRTNVAAYESLFIRGDNPTLAAVELQTIVEGAAQRMGVALGQRSVSTARKKDDFFNEITMTVTFEATAAQVSSFLAELRSAPKAISVRNAQISPTQIIHEAPAKGGFNKLLRANLTVAAPLPIPVRNSG